MFAQGLRRTTAPVISSGASATRRCSAALTTPGNTLRGRKIPGNTQSSRGIASLEGFGSHCFKGAVAAPYLEQQGLSPETLDSGVWASDDATSDKVSEEVFYLHIAHGCEICSSTPMQVPNTHVVACPDGLCDPCLGAGQWR